MAVNTVRSEVLTALAGWLAAITTANGYKTDVAAVKRGIHLFEDMTEKPAISVWNDTTRFEDTPGGIATRIIHVFIWGYVNIEPGNYDALDNLVADLENRLNNAPGLQLTNGGEIIDVAIKNITTYEGGASDPAGILEMEAEIECEYDRTNA